jgi:hypothetical protein
VAGVVFAGSVMTGVAPTGALGDGPRTVAAAQREYCAGLDSFSVHRLYRAYFLRDPDVDGLAYWQDVLATGRASLHGISQLFSTSTEFTNRYGALSNRAFVQLVYRNVMNREGEHEGVTYWTGLLDAGHPRGTVMLGFSDSPEFKERTGLVPPVPAATDPQVLPEVDPYTVYPGGEFRRTETETLRVDFHRYPIDIWYGDLLSYTGDQLLCLGWTVLDDGSNGSTVEVISENGIKIRALAFPVDATEEQEAYNLLIMRIDLVD